MLLLAEMLSAIEAREAGFVAAIVEDPRLDEHMGQLTERLVGYAPITMRICKESVRRIITAGPDEDEDLIHECY